jgi:hypothetical protein
MSEVLKGVARAQFTLLVGSHGVCNRMISSLFNPWTGPEKSNGEGQTFEDTWTAEHTGRVMARRAVDDVR